MLDVYEPKADVVRDPRRAEELGNRRSRSASDSTRTPAGKPARRESDAVGRRAARPDVLHGRPGEPARVRQLQTDVEIVGGARAEMRHVLADERCAKRPPASSSSRRPRSELIGIGTAVRADRHRFTTPDQLRAAAARSVASAGSSDRSACRPRAVPAFHRQDAEAIADSDAIHLDRAPRAARAPASAVVIEVERNAERSAGAHETPAAVLNDATRGKRRSLTMDARRTRCRRRRSLPDAQCRRPALRDCACASAARAAQVARASSAPPSRGARAAPGPRGA